MSAARRPSGLDALQGIPRVPLDDPTRRDAPAPAPAAPPAPASPPAEPRATTPPKPARSRRRRPTAPATPAPSRPSAPAPRTEGDSRVDSRSDLVPRSYVVPSALADQLRETSRALKTSDSALTNLLLDAALSDLSSLARFAGQYFTWRAELEDASEPAHDLTSVRISTQTPLGLVRDLERITDQLADAGGVRGRRMSRSNVVAMVLFGHFYDEQSGDLDPDLDALRTLRTDQMTQDLQRRLAALSDD